MSFPAHAATKKNSTPSQTVNSPPSSPPQTVTSPNTRRKLKDQFDKLSKIGKKTIHSNETPTVQNSKGTEETKKKKKWMNLRVKKGKVQKSKEKEKVKKTESRIKLEKRDIFNKFEELITSLRAIKAEQTKGFLRESGTQNEKLYQNYVSSKIPFEKLEINEAAGIFKKLFGELRLFDGQIINFPETDSLLSCNAKLKTSLKTILKSHSRKQLVMKLGQEEANKAKVKIDLDLNYKFLQGFIKHLQTQGSFHVWEGLLLAVLADPDKIKLVLSNLNQKQMTALKDLISYLKEVINQSDINMSSAYSLSCYFSQKLFPENAVEMGPELDSKEILGYHRLLNEIATAVFECLIEKSDRIFDHERGNFDALSTQSSSEGVQTVFIAESEESEEAASDVDNNEGRNESGYIGNWNELEKFLEDSIEGPSEQDEQHETLAYRQKSRHPSVEELEFFKRNTTPPPHKPSTPLQKEQHDDLSIKSQTVSKKLSASISEEIFEERSTESTPVEPSAASSSAATILHEESSPESTLKKLPASTSNYSVMKTLGFGSVALATTGGFVYQMATKRGEEILQMLEMKDQESSLFNWLLSPTKSGENALVRKDVFVYSGAMIGLFTGIFKTLQTGSQFFTDYKTTTSGEKRNQILAGLAWGSVALGSAYVAKTYL